MCGKCGYVILNEICTFITPLDSSRINEYENFLSPKEQAAVIIPSKNNNISESAEGFTEPKTAKDDIPETNVAVCNDEETREIPSEQTAEKTADNSAPITSSFNYTQIRSQERVTQYRRIREHKPRQNRRMWLIASAVLLAICLSVLALIFYTQATIAVFVVLLVAVVLFFNKWEKVMLIEIMICTLLNAVLALIFQDTYSVFFTFTSWGLVLLQFIIILMCYSAEETLGNFCILLFTLNIFFALFIFSGISWIWLLCLLLVFIVTICIVVACVERDKGRLAGIICPLIVVSLYITLNSVVPHFVHNMSDIPQTNATLDGEPTLICSCGEEVATPRWYVESIHSAFCPHWSYHWWETPITLIAKEDVESHSDSTHHWIYCDCGVIVYKGEHVFDQNGECICNYKNP